MQRAQNTARMLLFPLYRAHVNFSRNCLAMFAFTTHNHASSFLYFRLQRARMRSFFLSMSRIWAASLPAHKLQNESYSNRELLHLPGAGSWAHFSSPLINKCCATWAWYCLFSVTSNHVLVSFLGGTYLPFDLDGIHVIFVPVAKPNHHLVRQTWHSKWITKAIPYHGMKKTKGLFFIP